VLFYYYKALKTIEHNLPSIMLLGDIDWGGELNPCGIRLLRGPGDGDIPLIPLPALGDTPREL